MTCIVGLEHENSVYIGGDSAGVAGYDVVNRADEKVFGNGKMVMGFTVSFRMGQLLRYSFDIPKHPRTKDDMSYLTTTFIDTIRSVYNAKGYMHKEENADNGGGQLLFGYKKKLYIIDSDFQIGIPRNGYAAVGSGGCVALGAMYASKFTVEDPLARILTALEAAEEFNAGVRSPFVIYKLTAGRVSQCNY